MYVFKALDKSGGFSCNSCGVFRCSLFLSLDLGRLVNTLYKDMKRRIMQSKQILHKVFQVLVLFASEMHVTYVSIVPVLLACAHAMPPGLFEVTVTPSYVLACLLERSAACNWG